MAANKENEILKTRENRKGFNRPARKERATQRAFCRFSSKVYENVGYYYSIRTKC